MSWFPRFAEPWMLLLLMLVPWSMYLGLRIRSMSDGRRRTAVLLRAVILACVVCALAGMEILKQNDRLAVFFLLDHSNSVPEEVRQSAVQWVRNYCDTFMGERDEAGVIVFGEEASVELRVEPRLGLREVRSFVGGNETNLAGALRLAMAAFPEGYMRRIVAFSDGNETLGSALEEVKSARADGIEVNVVPLQTGGRQEVRVREVSAPSQTSMEEPFQLRIVVESEQETSGTLQVYQRVGTERKMVRPQQVQLQKGSNVFLLTQELPRAGFYEYEVEIESATDTFSQNNQGRAFTMVRGEPAVLCIEGTAGEGEFLERALVAEGLQVARTDAFGLPNSLAQLQNYDAVVLCDVSATQLGPEQLSLLEAAVRDLGIGLVMLGGPNSFGAGGYLDTPVERALPVDMDIKQRKVLPRGALAVVMHTCEIPSGNVWARDIALAALNVLASQDLMGALGYTYDKGDMWLFPLQAVGDKQAARQAIVLGSSAIGDMPATGPTLNMAYQALSTADAGVKRVVLISDGDPGGPGATLIGQFADAKIAVSTICIAPHSMSDQNMLRNVAEATGGNYYYVTDPQRLPQIFTKEASVVKKGMLIEEEFTPTPQHDSELLAGLGVSTLPSLLGYVVTSPKENVTIPLLSHEGDPVLAHWRYGLGKSVAFTSDATSRWAKHWLDWEGFNRYWAQSVRWALRETQPSNLQVETRRENGMGYVRVDAVDEQGQFINFLRPKGSVTTPGFEQRALELVQTGPGVYEAAFPARETGLYMMNLSYENQDGSAGLLTTGMAVDYSDEYVYHMTNTPMLEQMASAGGGVFFQENMNPFAHTLTAPPTVTPIWQYLLAVAVCLLPIEVFVRRVVVPFWWVALPFAWLLRKTPLVRKYLRTPALRTAPVTGRYLAAQPAGRPATTTEAAPARTVETFGEHLAPGTTAAEAKETREVVEAPKPPGHSAYTQRLFAAKERAKTQRKKEDE